MAQRFIDALFTGEERTIEEMAVSRPGGVIAGIKLSPVELSQRLRQFFSGRVTTHDLIEEEGQVTARIKGTPAQQSARTSLPRLIWLKFTGSGDKAKIAEVEVYTQMTLV